RVRFIAGDITDIGAVRSALKASGARRLIHLAGLRVPACKADPVAGAFVNVVGTLNVFESARALEVERVIYASSAAVFGAGDEESPLDESAASEPTTHYGVFKRANEGNARVYYLDHGLSSVGLRPLTVYGVNRDSGLTSDPTRAMKAAVLGVPFQIRFSGATDFQYVADTAAAFIACADGEPGESILSASMDTWGRTSATTRPDGTMRAGVLCGVRRMEVRDVPFPDVSPYEVLVRVSTVGLCGTDAHIFAGDANYHTDKFGQPIPFDVQPQVLGHEISGSVEEVGEEVRDLQAGDPVVIDQGLNCMSLRRPTLCDYCRTGDS